MRAARIRHFAVIAFCRDLRGWKHWRKKREGEVDERRGTVLQALVCAELEIAVRQGTIAEQRQQVREVRDVLGVMEEQRVEQRRRFRLLPLEVDLDELAAGEAVLAVNAEKTLAAFQLEIRKAEQALERPELLKEVEALDGVEAVRQAILLEHVAEEGNVEAVAVVGNQDFLRVKQLEKRLQYCRLIRDILTEKLEKRPAFISVCQYAYKIEAGAARREAGGFDIKKEDVLRGADHI